MNGNEPTASANSTVGVEYRKLTGFIPSATSTLPKVVSGRKMKLNPNDKYSVPNNGKAISARTRSR
jgi:hypothetical protein